jgi:hypothetical protein
MDPSSCYILAKKVPFLAGMIFMVLLADDLGWGRSQ